MNLAIRVERPCQRFMKQHGLPLHQPLVLSFTFLMNGGGTELIRSVLWIHANDSEIVDQNSGQAVRLMPEDIQFALDGRRATSPDVILRFLTGFWEVRLAGRRADRESEMYRYDQALHDYDPSYKTRFASSPRHPRLVVPASQTYGYIMLPVR